MAVTPTARDLHPAGTVQHSLRQIEAFEPRDPHEHEMKALNLRQMRAYLTGLRAVKR